jgi:biotin carboxyl carrier protein
MVGKVISVHVKSGDRLAERDPLITIEAMKMEVPIFTFLPGTVKEVFVKVGQTVQNDTIIAKLE